MCVDLDGDGSKEVIFASWYDDEVENGSLYILNCYGTLLSKTVLPKSKEYTYKSGAKAPPAVADVDNNGTYDIVINTLHGGICVYEIKP